MDIRPAALADTPDIQAIYAHHVLHGTGTFEEDPPSVEEMEARFRKVTDRGWAWLVATDATGVLGYAYYTQFRDRSAYRYTVENAIYVRDDLASGPGLFGALGSLIGVGVIAGIPLMSKAAKRISRQSLVLLGLAGLGLCVLFLTVIGTVWASVVGTLGIGIFVAFIFVPTQVLLQEATPKEMLGRISSSMMSVMTLSQTIALVFAGSIANVIGVRNLFYLSAALLIATAALGARALRKTAS